MDEQPVQLTSETRTPIPLAPGQVAKVDYEYIREGSCVVWMFVEPLGCWRDVRVTRRRTAVDWARQIRDLVDDPRYAEAEVITLVCDQLNTHDLGSLYAAFDPQEAETHCQQVGDCSHTETRKLVEHRRMRTECSHPAIA